MDFIKYLSAMTQNKSKSPRKNQTQSDGLHASAGYWVRLLSMAMVEDFNTRIREYGLARRQWPIVWAIRRGDASTPAQVARFVGIDPSAATRQLDQLENDGWIERRPNPKDRRSTTLHLTRKGNAVAPKLEACSKQTNGKFLEGISHKEGQAFLSSIRKMLANSDRPVVAF